MKHTAILIAIVFLIGISKSDAVKKPKAAENDKAAKNDKSTKNKAKDDEDEEKGEDKTDDGSEEEDEPPKKKTPAKKPPPKKGPTKKPAKKVDSEEEEEEEEVKPKGKKNTKSKLSDLKNEVASVNPANFLGALLNTPADKLKKALPQMKDLTNLLDGTPMGSIFKNLTSLLGNNSSEVWNRVFQFFPNFLQTIIGNATQLVAVAVTALGRAGKSFVEVTDTLFNAGKDLLEGASAIPGVGLITAPLAVGLDVIHGSLVTPLDAAADELKASGKRQQKRNERALSRSRSGVGR